MVVQHIGLLLILLTANGDSDLKTLVHIALTISMVVQIREG